MAETEDRVREDDHVAEDEEESTSFEELGLDARLVRALLKKGIDKPTPIQRTAIPLILEGKDVVARAKTGSGKTFAYLLPLMQKLLNHSVSKNKLAPNAFILVPTQELCRQVYLVISSLVELCRVQLKVAQLKSSMQLKDLRPALADVPNIVVSTPACISKCLSGGIMQSVSIGDSLETLVLDEADLLLSYGYENDIQMLAPHIPRSCQCLLMSATTSDDVDKLKKLILHNPFILTLPEVGNKKDDVVPKTVQQFWISCSAHDKLLYILALLKLELVQKKVLVFTNTIDMSFRVRLFLEKFGIKSAILNAELPQNSRLHIIEEFNAGLFDYLIATDACQPKDKEGTKVESNEQGRSNKNIKRKLDSEFGVVRGIDFKNVYTVINFDMPLNVVGYVHRIGRTGRAYNTGSSISFVSPDEMEIFEEIKSFIGDGENQGTNPVAEFPFLSKSAVESLRYRAEDIAKSVTKIAVRESRAQDLRNEILNSDKLKSHFEANPRDLELLKHDKLLSKNLPPPHLRDVPDYLIDQTTKEARERVRLARDAMGKRNRRQGSKKKFRKSKDPLKALSADASKRGGKTGAKRDVSHKGDGTKIKKQKC